MVRPPVFGQIVAPAEYPFRNTLPAHRAGYLVDTITDEIVHGCVGGNIEWETEHAILHRRTLIRYPGRHLCKPES